MADLLSIETHLNGRIHAGRRMSLDYWLHPKLDVIVPTADQSKFPASESIPRNRQATGWGDSIRFIVVEASGPDFSFARSINFGLKQTRRDVSVLLLNDDCFLDDHWLLPTLSAVRSHPDAIIGGLLRFPNQIDGNGNVWSGRKALNHIGGEYQHAGGFIPTTIRENVSAMFRFAIWHAAPLWVLRQIPAVVKGDGFRFPGHFHSLKPSHRINLVTAAAMILTPEAREIVGPFDEDFPLGFEDTDYCLRALEADFEMCLATDLSGFHFESLTTRHLEDRKRESYQVFAKKWPTSRIKKAVGKKRGIVHPDFCECGAWVE